MSDILSPPAAVSAAITDALAGKLTDGVELWLSDSSAAAAAKCGGTARFLLQVAPSITGAGVMLVGQVTPQFTCFTGTKVQKLMLTRLPQDISRTRWFGNENARFGGGDASLLAQACRQSSSRAYSNSAVTKICKLGY